MIRLFNISLLLISILFWSCSGPESNLKGKWKLIKEVNNQGQVIDPKISEVKELTYEFHDQNRYSKQGIADGAGKENLITNTGQWQLNEVEKEKTAPESWKLLLREEKIEGILEMVCEVVTLTDKELVWLDSRKNKFYFSKVSE